MSPEEYNTCVKKNGHDVYAFLLRLTQNHEEAEDILQDCYEKMWEKLEIIEFEKSKSYLFTTACNKFKNYIRGRLKREDLDKVGPEIISHNEQYSDLMEILEKALDLLPEIQKAVVLFKELGGYNNKEIADMTCLSESQVSVYLDRATDSLREYLAKLDMVLYLR